MSKNEEIAKYGLLFPQWILTVGILSEGKSLELFRPKFLLFKIKVN